MDFLKTDLAKLFWTLICVAIFIGLMVRLVKSAIDSLKRSKGSWKSVFDEIGIGVIVIVCFILVVQMDLSTIVEYLKTPVVAIWNMFINLLRQVGVPI